MSRSVALKKGWAAVAEYDGPNNIGLMTKAYYDTTHAATQDGWKEDRKIKTELHFADDELAVGLPFELLGQPFAAAGTDVISTLARPLGAPPGVAFPAPVAAFVVVKNGAPMAGAAPSTGPGAVQKPRATPLVLPVKLAAGNIAYKVFRSQVETGLRDAYWGDVPSDSWMPQIIANMEHGFADQVRTCGLDRLPYEEFWVALATEIPETITDQERMLELFKNKCPDGISTVTGWIGTLARKFLATHGCDSFPQLDKVYGDEAARKIHRKAYGELLFATAQPAARTQLATKKVELLAACESYEGIKTLTRQLIAIGAATARRTGTSQVLAIEGAGSSNEADGGSRLDRIEAALVALTSNGGGGRKGGKPKGAPPSPCPACTRAGVDPAKANHWLSDCKHPAKTACFDCGQQGHRRGDAACPGKEE